MYRYARLAGMLTTALTVASGLALPVVAQVTDLSGSGGQFGDRFDNAVQRAAGGAPGTGFFVIFRFDGLVPTDVKAGGGGSMVINRYDGWIVSDMSGLMPSRNVWDQLESGERLLDLSTMQMADPDPEPALISRRLLAIVRGKVVSRGEVKLEDVSLRLPEGKIRLRDRTAMWIGDAGRSELETWIGSQMVSLDASDDRSVRRDLVGLLSLQPRGGDVLSMLQALASEDPDRSIKTAAITYLGRRPEDTAGTLTSILSGAENPEERSVALKTLADRIGPAAADRLIEAARDEGEAEEVRRIAIACLGRIDAPAASDALENVFNSATAESVRRRALMELIEKRIGDPEIVNWLVSVALSDSSLEIRKEAVRQIGRTNTPQARRALEELIRVGRQ